MQMFMSNAKVYDIWCLMLLVYSMKFSEITEGEFWWFVGIYIAGRFILERMENSHNNGK